MIVQRSKWIIWAGSICVVTLFAAGVLANQMEHPKGPAETVVVDFKGIAPDSWQPVNDGVMGGLSQGGLRLTEDGTGVFEGEVSLDNKGGFASVRTSLGRADLSQFKGLSVRCRGDGKRYRIRLRIDDTNDGIAYQATFETKPNEWVSVQLPFVDFIPTFRGRKVSAPPLNTMTVRQLGFMIADKQKGQFRLEIDSVSAYGSSDGDAD